MMRTLLFVPLTACTLSLIGQARLVINDDAYVVFDRTAPAAQETWLVIANNNIQGIQVTGTGGNIISERERNYIRWNIGATVGSYTVPFTSPANVKMPLVYSKTTTGAGAGSVVFSTYNHGGLPNPFLNNPYRPSDVTHMNDDATGAVDNSLWVIDRFWIIDAQHPLYAYTTRPSASINFGYDAQDVTAGNTINGLSPLNAQRFNNALNKWGDFKPTCAWADLGGQRRSVQVPIAGVVDGANFFRSWTLSDINNPLPIELVDFKGECENGKVLLTWVTASETDNDFFTVEKSVDNSDWFPIGTVQGAGNSLSTITYTFNDPHPSGVAYYRLVQTDFDRATSTSPTIMAGCAIQNGIEIVNAWDDGNLVNLVVSSSLETMLDLDMLDSRGRSMANRPSQAIMNGLTLLTLPKTRIASGVYVLQLRNSEHLLTRRIVLQ